MCEVGPGGAITPEALRFVLSCFFLLSHVDRVGGLKVFAATVTDLISCFKHITCYISDADF